MFALFSFSEAFSPRVLQFVAAHKTRLHCVCGVSLVSRFCVSVRLRVSSCVRVRGIFPLVLQVQDVADDVTSLRTVPDHHGKWCDVFVKRTTAGRLAVIFSRCHRSNPRLRLHAVEDVIMTS